MSSSTLDYTRIVTLGHTIVFTVPDRVAQELGIFERNGVEVVPSGGWTASANSFVPGHPERDPLGAFEHVKFDTWNMCEWGAVHRVEKGESRPARIAYLRPAVVVQAIVSLDRALQEPHDLAGVTVGIHETTGQHYTTLQLLEGTLRRDQIKVSHGEGNLVDSLHTGEFRAVTVMEPYISLALKEGAHIIAQTFYRGAQTFAETVPLGAQQAYVRSVNEAVDVINAAPDRYRAYITELAGDRLAPEELRRDYYRYTHAKPYSAERFADTYAWMQSWGLARGDKTFDEIINPAVLSASGV
ncbi:MAG TPA: hypothetical protein VL984_16695 [Acidimicrobiales bacterium]|nr:hypothetical protein [Acidimicrobiales bacterium]